MAAGSLLALLDDIATILDDVGVLAKVAAKKTAGVLGDDLALNAQQVTGVRAARELPVVWAVAKGSLLNKVILVPAALLISAFAPWAVTPLLMLGGGFLCYEGFEKLVHAFGHHPAEDAHRAELSQALTDPDKDMREVERDRIKGAVRTDFILSAEIIAITLGTVSQAPFVTQFAVLAGIAVAVTVGVYGLVAGIVKLDDGGIWLTERAGGGAWARAQRKLGEAILWVAPWMMKALSIAGTAAMFLVGGGILTHGIGPLHHWIEELLGERGGIVGTLGPMLLNGLFGIAAGALVLAVATLARRIWPGGGKPDGATKSGRPRGKRVGPGAAARGADCRPLRAAIPEARQGRQRSPCRPAGSVGLRLARSELRAQRRRLGPLGEGHLRREQRVEGVACPRLVARLGVAGREVILQHGRLRRLRRGFLQQRQAALDVALLEQDPAHGVGDDGVARARLVRPLGQLQGARVALLVVEPGEVVERYGVGRLGLQRRLVVPDRLRLPAGGQVDLRQVQPHLASACRPGDPFGGLLVGFPGLAGLQQRAVQLDEDVWRRRLLEGGGVGLHGPGGILLRQQGLAFEEGAVRGSGYWVRSSRASRRASTGWPLRVSTLARTAFAAA